MFELALRDWEREMTSFDHGVTHADSVLNQQNVVVCQMRGLQLFANFFNIEFVLQTAISQARRINEDHVLEMTVF